MGLGVSLFLIAVGAILVWGVQTDIAGVSEDAIGVILMVVGGAGLLLSMLFWSSWGGFRRRTYVDRGVDRPVYTTPAAPRRTVVEEDEVAPPGPPPP